MNMQKTFLFIIIFLALSFLFHAQDSAEDILNILDDLEAYAVQIMEQQNIPGMAYAIVHDDQILYSNAFGVKSLETNEPVDIFTMFEIGSTSKAFSSFAIARLIDEGLIQWHDRILYHLPEFDLYDKWVKGEFQIADLFSQRSGLQPYSLDFLPLLGFDRQDIIRAMRFLRPVSQFRHNFGYLNNIFMVSAAIIEQISGISWEDYLEQEIFAPLEMTNTSAKKQVINSYTNRANGHMIIDAQGTVWTIPHDWRYNQWIFTMGPAGGIYSNVTEMCNWLRMHLNNGTFNDSSIISPVNLKYTYNPSIFISFDDYGFPLSYSQAWVFQAHSPVSVLWHNGMTFGMHSIVAILPKADIGLVVLTNSSNNNAPTLLMEKLYGLLFFDEKSDIGLIPPVKLSSAPFNYPDQIDFTNLSKPDKDLHNELIGIYHNPAYRLAVVYEEDGTLYMKIGASGSELISPLYYSQNNIYVFVIPDFPNAYLTVTFQKEAGQPAEALFLDACSDVDEGRFGRIFN